MGHITIDHLKSSFIAIPNMELISKIDLKLTPIINKIISNLKQNQELAQLRDWLLPMLMNGQVRVEDVQNEVLGMAAESEVSYRSSASIKI